MAAAFSLLALNRLLLVSPKSLPLAPSRLFSTKPQFAKPELAADVFSRHLHDDFGSSIVRRLPYPSFAHVTDEGLNIREDMPGLGKGDVEVLVEQNRLIMKGERKMEQELSGMVYEYSATYYISEEEFDLNKVKVVIKNVELNILVPKVVKDQKGD